MKAMILAAGRGERMRPLTDHCPKPLLKVDGTPLIEHHINKLAQCGITDIVINYAWLGEMIASHLGDGKKLGVNITYSPEQYGALETAGGIIQALPFLTNNQNDEPFLLINGDVYTDFDYSTLALLEDDCLAHIYLVKNPEHNKGGDFIYDNKQLKNIVALSTKATSPELTFTFSGLSIIRPSFFQGQNVGQPLKLGPMLKRTIEQGKVSASLLHGLWTDVGTPERLKTLNERLTIND